MFTGLIESVGQITGLEVSAAGLRLTLATTLAPELAQGESLAVNGVCLTVVSAAGREVCMDVSPETIRVTTLGGLSAGTLVNLERSLVAGGRIGGHFVQGHVDATGVLEEIRPQGESYWITVGHPPELAQYLVSKGSVAVDGISLTVAAVDERSFSVQVIPFTWQHTNLHAAAAGAGVNLESDMLGKYVVRALAVPAGNRGGLD